MNSQTILPMGEQPTMNARPDVARVVLCLADTKLVLGNVCVATVFNGRSLGDFATLLAIAGTSFGASRALYRWLESSCGQQYDWLERGRGPDEIASLDALDAAPRSWMDLMVTLFLAEATSSALARRLMVQGDPILANQGRVLVRDCAFHMAYCQGWLKVLPEGERQALHGCLDARAPLALRYLESVDPQAREQFMTDIAALGQLGGHSLPAAAPTGAHWDPSRSREKPLPDRLWAIVRFKDQELLA